MQFDYVIDDEDEFEDPISSDVTRNSQMAMNTGGRQSSEFDAAFDTE